MLCPNRRLVAGGSFFRRSLHRRAFRLQRIAFTDKIYKQIVSIHTPCGMLKMPPGREAGRGVIFES